MERPRKAPAVEKTVSEIKAEDIRVRVLGTVISEGNEKFLDDGTGKIKISGRDADAGEKVRVFARPFVDKKNLELAVELVQDMSGLNENLYKKVKAHIMKGG